MVSKNEIIDIIREEDSKRAKIQQTIQKAKILTKVGSFVQASLEDCAKQDELCSVVKKCFNVASCTDVQEKELEDQIQSVIEWVTKQEEIDTDARRLIAYLSVFASAVLEAQKPSAFVQSSELLSKIQNIGNLLQLVPNPSPIGVNPVPRSPLWPFGTSGEVGVFGSAAAGVPTLTTDVETMQSFSAWQMGWIAATLGGLKLPALEEMNTTTTVHNQVLMNLLQNSCAEWNNITPYFIGSIVNDGNNNIYTSLSGVAGSPNIGNAPSTSPQLWKQTIPSIVSPISSGVSLYSNFTVTWTPNAGTFTVGALTMFYSSLSQNSPSVNPFVSYLSRVIDLSTCPAPSNQITIWYVTYSYNVSTPATPVVGWTQTPSFLGTGQDSPVVARVVVVNTAGLRRIASTATGVLAFPWINASSINAKSDGIVASAVVGPSTSNNLNLRSGVGTLSFDGINYGSANPFRKTLAASLPLTFAMISPANNASLTLPVSTTNVAVAQYWNGTALVNVPAGNATVQQVLLTAAGNYLVQYGEKLYVTAGAVTALQAAFSDIENAPFTTLLQASDATVVARFAVLQNATNLNNQAQALFISLVLGRNGGSGVVTIPDHNALQGLQGGGSGFYGHTPPVHSSLRNALLQVSADGTSWQASGKAGIELTNLMSNQDRGNINLQSGVTYWFNNGTVTNPIPDGGTGIYTLQFIAQQCVGNSYDNYSYLCIGLSNNRTYTYNKPFGSTGVWNWINQPAVPLASGANQLVTSNTDGSVSAKTWLQLYTEQQQNILNLANFATVPTGQFGVYNYTILQAQRPPVPSNVYLSLTQTIASYDNTLAGSQASYVAIVAKDFSTENATGKMFTTTVTNGVLQPWVEVARQTVVTFTPTSGIRVDVFYIQRIGRVVTFLARLQNQTGGTITTRTLGNFSVAGANIAGGQNISIPGAVLNIQSGSNRLEFISGTWNNTAYLFTQLVSFFTL